MPVEVWNGEDRQVVVSPGDVTGAVGDSVTVLPVVVAVAALTDLRLPTLLLGFAVLQVGWGLRYGVPVSVEPMKALAGLVIAGALSAPELLSAGLLAGGVLLTLGSVGAVGRLADAVGEPVVRGVQLSVALVLARRVSTWASRHRRRPRWRSASRRSLSRWATAAPAPWPCSRWASSSRGSTSACRRPTSPRSRPASDSR